MNREEITTAIGCSNEGEESVYEYNLEGHTLIHKTLDVFVDSIEGFAIP